MPNSSEYSVLCHVSHAPPHYNPIIINTSCRWSSFIEESVLLFFVRARNSMCHTPSTNARVWQHTFAHTNTHKYNCSMADESYSCAILCICVEHRIEWLFMMMMVMMIWFRWGLNFSCQNVDFPTIMWFLWPKSEMIRLKSWMSKEKPLMQTQKRTSVEISSMQIKSSK